MSCTPGRSVRPRYSAAKLMRSTRVPLSIHSCPVCQPSTVGEHRDEIKPGLFEISQEPKYMGMDLMNPPTVEGWHTGHEWIDSGTLVERINFASEYLGQTALPGVRDMIDRLMARGARLSPEAFVDGCIDMVGCLNLTDDTRQTLTAHAQRGGELSHGTDAEKAEFTRRTGEMFQMLAATGEFQFC